MTDLTPQEIISLLQLEPLPEEGGMFRQGFSDAHSTAIYYFLEAGDFSALHLLTGVEVYHWYAGSPLELLQLHPDGSSEIVVLGPDLRAGQRPQFPALAGIWQGSAPLGAWTLVGTTMAPSFDWDGFTLGERAALIAQYPDRAAEITALTR
ncbi:MAG: cupin domain-containing protein [Microbacteriaceae bacterium]